MRRTSPYYYLQYVVECKQTYVFEPMAAFNVDTVALWYAQQCCAANGSFTYRVMARKGRNWVLVEKAGQ